MALDPEARALARDFAELREQVRALSTARQIDRSTVEIGGEPVRVPDALTAGVQAGAVAGEALQGAADALAEAALARTTADGKNRIFASQTEPTGEHVPGDLWYVLDGEDRVVGIQVSDGTEWVEFSLVANQLLVPGSVGPVQIADGAVTAPKVTVDQAFINKLFVDDMLVNALTGQTITGAVIRTAASGRRMETEATQVAFYDENNQPAGQIYGVSNGQGGGVIRIGGGVYDLTVGRHELPAGGVAYASTDAMWVTELFLGPQGRQFNPSALPFAMAGGTFIVNDEWSPGAFTDVSISFPAGRFTTAPIVIPSTSQVRLNVAALSGVTTGGCTLRIFNPTNVTVTNAVIRWEAIQMTKDTAAG